MCLQSLSGLGKLSWQPNGLAAQQTIQKIKRGESAIRNKGRTASKPHGKTAQIPQASNCQNVHPKDTVTQLVEDNVLVS